MILLSNVIKAPFAKTDHHNKKMIEIKQYFLQQPAVSPLEQNEQEEAQMLIDEAKRQAQLIQQEAEHYYHSVKQQILQEQEQWQIERQQLVRAAQQEGYDAGFIQGKEEALRQYEQLIHEAKRIIETANEQFYEQMDAANETILLIGLKVAERIVGEKLTENHEYLLSLVKQAIKEAREQSEVKIYVHPRYYDWLAQQKEELKAMFSEPVDLFLYPDEQLQETGCIIETPFGRIDASVDTQLQQIKEQLLERLEEATS